MEQCIEHVQNTNSGLADLVYGFTNGMDSSEM